MEFNPLLDDHNVIFHFMSCRARLFNFYIHLDLITIFQ